MVQTALVLGEQLSHLHMSQQVDQPHVRARLLDVRNGRAHAGVSGGPVGEQLFQAALGIQLAKRLMD